MHLILGWGLLSRYPPLRYFPIFFDIIFDKCRDTCQIWMRFKECNRYFCEIEKLACGEIDERNFSNPHLWTLMLQTRWGRVTQHGVTELAEHCLTAPSRFPKKYWYFIGMYPWIHLSGIKVKPCEWKGAPGDSDPVFMANIVAADDQGADRQIEQTKQTGQTDRHTYRQKVFCIMLYDTKQSLIVKCGDIYVANKIEKYRLGLTFFVIDGSLCNINWLVLSELRRYAYQIKIIKIPLQYYTIGICGRILSVFGQQRTNVLRYIIRKPEWLALEARTTKQTIWCYYIQKIFTANFNVWAYYSILQFM